MLSFFGRIVKMKITSENNNKQVIQFFSLQFSHHFDFLIAVSPFSVSHCKVVALVRLGFYDRFQRHRRTVGGVRFIPFDVKDRERRGEKTKDKREENERIKKEERGEKRPRTTRVSCIRGVQLFTSPLSLCVRRFFFSKLKNSKLRIRKNSFSLVH